MPFDYAMRLKKLFTILFCFAPVKRKLMVRQQQTSLGYNVQIKKIKTNQNHIKNILFNTKLQIFLLFFRYKYLNFLANNRYLNNFKKLILCLAIVVMQRKECREFRHHSLQKKSACEDKTGWPAFGQDKCVMYFFATLVTLWSSHEGNIYHLEHPFSEFRDLIPDFCTALAKLELTRNLQMQILIQGCKLFAC